MERLKSITIIFLLAIGLLASAAPAKPASVLLQEGLYAEEIEGDLDAAIKIYEQVVVEAKKVQRTAAHATYRIGMCYLKKGQKDKAAEYFQNIISDFPSQKAFARKAEKQLDKIKPRAERIVEQAVMTISTCAEGDPRVTKALESLKGLDENVVVNELIKFLNSETNTVRRSAIYILWKGELKDVSAAVPTLEKLCSHKEVITRGMAAIALGAAKVDSSFDVLCDMTLKDPSGYTRRCAAYALGLMGRADAKPILEKAIKDSDPLVQNNAEAALTMLSKAAKAFPELLGCRIKETLEMKFTEPGEEWWLKDPGTTRTVYENTQLEIEWEVDRIISGKSEVFAISVLPDGIDIHDFDFSMWFETDIPITARKTKYGYPWKGVAGKIGTFRKAKRLVTGEYKVFLYAFGNLSSDRGWQKLLKDNLIGVATAKLNVKPMPYTQISINDIQPDGTIRFKNILQEINQQGVQITTRSFINSDFVQVKSMFDSEGRPIEFTAKHQDNIYRYNLTFDKPVLPGEAMLYGCEGTITGLIHPLKGTKDVFRYFMVHSPSTNRPTRRIETYRLPEGAELISTTPKDMAHRIKDGRIELYIEKMIPIGGNITTAFQYRYKMLQKESAGRIVFLPDADDVIQQGKVAVVLDLTTGKMLPGNKDKQYFNKLNKGDVAYFDDEGKDLLVCFRGAKITRKTANGKYYDTPDQSHTDNTVHIYIIKKTPAEWTITTKEGDIYELKVLSLDNNLAKIKYRKMSGSSNTKRVNLISVNKQDK